MQEKKQLLYTISVENYHCISNITTFPYNTNARNKLYILGLYQEKIKPNDIYLIYTLMFGPSLPDFFIPVGKKKCFRKVSLKSHVSTFHLQIQKYKNKIKRYKSNYT